jgi:hypothetical protein
MAFLDVCKWHSRVAKHETFLLRVAIQQPQDLWLRGVRKTRTGDISRYYGSCQGGQFGDDGQVAADWIPMVEK